MIKLETQAPPKGIADIIPLLHLYFDHNFYTIGASKPPPCDCDDPDCRSDDAWDLHVNPVYRGEDEDEAMNTMDVLGFCKGLIESKVAVPNSVYADFSVGGNGALEIGTILDTEEKTPIRIYVYHDPVGGGGCICGMCETEDDDKPKYVN